MFNLKKTFTHLYTLPYLFIILIKVFDLKVVDPERCFNLPI